MGGCVWRAVWGGCGRVLEGLKKLKILVNVSIAEVFLHGQFNSFTSWLTLRLES